LDEFRDAVGPDDAGWAAEFYGVSAAGNFEQRNILHAAVDPVSFAVRMGWEPDGLCEALDAVRARLLAARSARVEPRKDDKVLAEWNGMMIAAFARSAMRLGRDDHAQAALRAGGFVRGQMIRDGVLMRSFRAGTAGIPAYLEDYAQVASGFLELFELTFDAEWLRATRGLADAMLAEFGGAGGGALYATSARHPALFARLQPVADGAAPSGNAAAAALLVRLARLTGATAYGQRAEQLLRAVAPVAQRYPTACSGVLLALDARLSAGIEIAVVGRPDDARTRELLRAARGVYAPYAVTALRDPGAAPDAPGGGSDVPFLQARELVDGSPAVYVCVDRTCKKPMTRGDEIAKNLDSLSRQGSGRTKTP
jgi:uncharacterized protein YyaL (SSP411 family)